MIYTGYHAKNKLYEANGLMTVSISIGAPRHYKPMLTYGILCPTWAMVKANYTEQEYFDKILKKLSAAEVKKDLELFAKGKDIVLLCYEKNPLECHRSFVSNWFKRNGIECKEYEKIEPQQIQTTQTNLF